MRKAFRTLGFVGVVTLLTGCPSFKKGGGKGDLVEGKGKQAVVMHCTRCHGPQLMTSLKLDRKGWEKVIRRMQADRGLWKLSSEVEEEILDYLSTHYGTASKPSAK